MSIAVAVKTGTDLFCQFFAQLHRAEDRVLLLDYDGTIAPFTVHRNRAYPYPTVAELLDCIMSTCRTRVALITGRAAREIPPLLGLNPAPEIWGSHGIERLCPDGRYCSVQVSKEVQHALAEADAWLEEEGLDRIVESKPGGVAVHWRGLSPARLEEVRTKAYRALLPLAGQADLLLAEFEGGIELRVRSRTKGDAVQAVLSEVEPGASIAYLGDDSTDEDAFRVLNDCGLTVLVRPTYRFTAAQAWLRPPDELVQFLSDWVRACGGDM
ncbi:MAG: trehalose-phosphatase [Terriglobales bacterium]